MADFEKTHGRAGRFAEKLQKMKGSIGGYVLALGCGGVICFMLQQSFPFDRTSFSQKIEAAVGESSLSIDPSMAVILLLSIVALAVAPVIISGERRWGRRIALLLLLILAELTLLGMTVTTDCSMVPLELCTWFLCSYVIRLLTLVVGVLQQWITLKEDSKKYDIAKLTLIWTILAFILGKVL